MSDDHEQVHEQLEQEADELEHESERLGERVEEAKEANQSLESDQLIATPREFGDEDED